MTETARADENNLSHVANLAKSKFMDRSLKPLTSAIENKDNASLL